jgi:hypothetical protein
MRLGDAALATGDFAGAAARYTEFLEAYPERKEEVQRLTREGRLEWGATYNQPYEAWLSGEELVRQTYFGRRWIRRNLPGCDARVAFNPDVPGRSLQMQQILAKAGIPYLLVGVGRWGSTDPWLGIPVTWDQIAGARAIVESGFKDFKVTPSQGTHFFQNLTSGNVGYFTVNPDADEGFVDWDGLAGQPALAESGCVRHLRFREPIVVKMNGRKNEGIILKPCLEAMEGSMDESVRRAAELSVGEFYAHALAIDAGHAGGGGAGAGHSHPRPGGRLRFRHAGRDDLRRFPGREERQTGLGICQSGCGSGRWES